MFPLNSSTTTIPHQRRTDVEKSRKLNQNKSLVVKKPKAPKQPDVGRVSQFGLSEHERSVLAVFRRYLMTPGRMLCFSRPDMETYKAPLARLISEQFLFAEKFPGGFSLTEIGYAAMKDDE
jgi:hypothetical protein